MGPSGYKFGKYWRLGLPLSIIVVLVAMPMLMLVWPFFKTAPMHSTHAIALPKRTPLHLG